MREKDRKQNKIVPSSRLLRLASPLWKVVVRKSDSFSTPRLLWCVRTCSTVPSKIAHVDVDLRWFVGCARRFRL